MDTPVCLFSNKFIHLSSVNNCFHIFFARYFYVIVENYYWLDACNRLSVDKLNSNQTQAPEPFSFSLKRFLFLWNAHWMQHPITLSICEFRFLLLFCVIKCSNKVVLKLLPTIKILEKMLANTNWINWCPFLLQVYFTGFNCLFLFLSTCFFCVFKSDIHIFRVYVLAFFFSLLFAALLYNIAFVDCLHQIYFFLYFYIHYYYYYLFYIFPDEVFLAFLIYCRAFGPSFVRTFNICFAWLYHLCVAIASIFFRNVQQLFSERMTREWNNVGGKM